MYQKVIQLLMIRGYEKIDSEVGPCYHKKENGIQKGVFVFFDTKADGSIYRREDINHMIHVGKQLLGEKSPILILLLSDEGKPQWIDYEQAFEELFEPIGITIAESKTNEKKQNMHLNGSIFQKYKITILILLVNVFMYFVSEWMGNEIYDRGANSWYYVVEQHQWYRLLTSNFLHYGFDHLFNNMLVFLVVGSRMEYILGSIAYVFVYVGSGLIGSVVSVYYYMMMGENVLSAGASGAIFGLIGALIWVMMRNKGNVQGLYRRGMLIMVAGSLYHGISSAGVDNAAHIGGLVGGMLLTMICYEWHLRKSK